MTQLPSASCWVTELISSDIANLCTTDETPAMVLHAGSSWAPRLVGLILFSGFWLVFKRKQILPPDFGKKELHVYARGKTGG